MSLAHDLQAIRARFLDQWDQDAVQTLFANGEAVDVDETEGFVRFSINPGSRALVLGGAKRYEQLGRVILQVFVPQAHGLARGYDLVEAFTDVFRDWQSGDLRCGDYDVFQDPSSINGMYQINVSVRWSSLHDVKQGRSEAPNK